MSGQATINYRGKVLVDTSVSEAALLAAVICLRARQMKISLGCLLCAYNGIGRHDDTESVAIIAAKWGKS